MLVLSRKFELKKELAGGLKQLILTRPLFKVLEIYISHWKGGDKIYLQVVRIKIPS